MEMQISSMSARLYLHLNIREDSLSFISGKTLYRCSLNDAPEVVTQSCEHSSQAWGTYTWLSGGETLIYSTQMENHRYALIAFNVNTQASHILLEQETKLELILSHDETTLLMKCDNEAYFFDMDSGSLTQKRTHRSPQSYGENT
ncbi:hypothetical protein [Enterocloster lavalensis]|uniref:hypothetical protein n=1 Tax=Enterocloster lavalensis TaxID=460384 RepID=UPI0034A45A3B